MSIVFVVQFQALFFISTFVNMLNDPKQIPLPLFYQKTIKTTSIARTIASTYISSVCFLLVTMDLKISGVLNKILHLSFWHGQAIGTGLSES